MKIIFIGPKAIQEALANMEPQWDFQSPIESIQEFFEEMNKESGSKVSDETSAIIIFSRLFTDLNKSTSERKDFAKTIAYYAPHAAVGILIPDEERDEEHKIRQEVRTVSREERLNVENAPFYFISYENVPQDLYNSFVDYATTPNGGQGAQTAIKASLPQSFFVSTDNGEVEAYEEFNETPYDEGVYIPESGGQGKVIAVTSSKGGSGKSTVSLLLGTYLAQSSLISEMNSTEESALKVCVVDLDVRDGQLGFLNGQVQPNVITIMEAASKSPGADMSEEAIRKGIYSSPNLKCDFIFAAKRPKHAKNIPASFYAQIIQKLRGMYDIIILDTSVNYLDELLSKVAYPLAEQILFVTDMGVSSVFGMARWIKETTDSEEAGGNGISRNKIGIIVNKALANVNIGQQEIEQASQNLEVLAYLPSAPTLITYAANTNQLDVVLKNEYLNQSFKDLAETIMGDDYTLSEIPYESSQKK